MANESIKYLLQGVIVVAMVMYIIPQVTGESVMSFNDALVLGALCVVGFILLDSIFPSIENYKTADDCIKQDFYSKSLKELKQMRVDFETAGGRIMSLISIKQVINGGDVNYTLPGQKKPYKLTLGNPTNFNPTNFDKLITTLNNTLKEAHKKRPSKVPKEVTDINSLILALEIKYYNDCIARPGLKEGDPIVTFYNKNIRPFHIK